jgi:CubicO group peptidase (beta-lactamase class C family)
MRRINRVYRAALVVGLFALVVQPATAREPAPLTGIDAYIRHSMRAWHDPGLAIAVVKDGKIVMAEGFGVRTLGKSAKVDKNTLFAIASNTKAFTAASLGILVDAGKLAWDSRVAEYLKGFELYSPYATREVSVRDLLTHRTGYCNNSFLWYGTNNTRAEILSKLRLIKPQYSFRDRFCYSNIMFMAAGQIIPAVTGMNWGAFVKRRIFKPLGMIHSNITIAAMGRSQDAATPYAEIGGQLKPLHRYYQKNIAPAGAINSSVADMSHWLETLLANGKYHGRRILSAAAVHEMETPQIPVSSKTFYGLGLFLEDYHGERIVSHDGQIDGMSSTVGMIPDRHLGIVVLSNLQLNKLPEALMYRVFDDYLGMPKKDWSARLLKKSKPAWPHPLTGQAKRRQEKLMHARATHPQASLPLRDYVGTYTDRLHGKVTIAMAQGHLVLRRGRIFVGDLQPWDHDTFRVVWRYRFLGKDYCEFFLSPAGHVDKLALFKYGTYERQEHK